MKADNVNSTTFSWDDYEDVSLDIDPSRLYAMHNPLTKIDNPQTKRDIEANVSIDRILESIRPYIGRKICVGKHGSYSYFLKPEAVGTGIRMNCFVSVSIG